MAGIGDEDLGPVRVAAVAVVGPDHEDAGQLALGTGRGLEGDRLHARDLGQGAFQLPEQLQRALGDLVGGHRVELGEAAQAGGPLVELGVELHRARAERVEPGVDRVVELAQVDVVADDVRLVHLGEGGRGDPASRRGQPIQRVLGRVRDLAAAATRAAALEDRGLEARAGDAHRTPPPTAVAAGGRPR